VRVRSYEEMLLPGMLDGPREAVFVGATREMDEGRMDCGIELKVLYREVIAGTKARRGGQGKRRRACLTFKLKSSKFCNANFQFLNF
jgi:hypothetical protein